MLTVSNTPAIGSLALVTPAGTYPVSVDEMKLMSRLDTVAEGDGFITALIASATRAVSDWTGRALFTETWTLTLDDWPGCGDIWWDGMREGTPAMVQGGSVHIRKAPFLAITSVKTIDEDGTETTFASSEYYAITESGMGRLCLRNGSTWPIIQPPVRARGGIKITFTAGYGTTSTDVPAPIRQAIKLLVAHYYENREATAETGAEMPYAIARLLSPYKVLR